MFRKWEKVLYGHMRRERGIRNKKSRCSGAFVNLFVKEETKVKTETANTTSGSGDSLMVPPPPAVASSGASISNYVSKNDVLKAEIIWTMQTIMKQIRTSPMKP